MGVMALAPKSFGLFFPSSATFLPPSPGWISAFFPFPPPTRFACTEESQEQKVKLDLSPLFFKFYFGIHCLLFAKLLQFLFPSAHAACPAWGTRSASSARPGGHRFPAGGGGGTNTNPKARGTPVWVWISLCRGAAAPGAELRSLLSPSGWERLIPRAEALELPTCILTASPQCSQRV